MNKFKLWRRLTSRHWARLEREGWIRISSYQHYCIEVMLENGFGQKMRNQQVLELEDY